MKKAILLERARNLNREYIHPSYSYEVKLLSEITLGLADSAYKTLDVINSLERATLSKKPLQSKKNSLIIWCSLFTRSAIDAGVPYEDAFALSDIVINHIDSIKEIEKLMKFEYVMVKDFIDLIKESKVTKYPYPISKITRYIYANASKTLTVSGIAKMYDLNPDYLSKKFKDEVGISMTGFIQKEKVALAKNLLEFSHLSITEIATLLDYSSPGYFTRTFKKHTFMSPYDYRKEFLKHEY